MHISCALLTGQLHHSYGNDDSEYIPFYHLGVYYEICTHYHKTHKYSCLPGFAYAMGYPMCKARGSVETDKGDVPIWKEYFQLWYMQGMPYALYDNYAYVTL